MGDYNLNGLNPRDFQHLVQAIARKQIAAGVTSFGDGPDGARDLTYRGKMDYPSVAGSWDGYLVLGCKFCQRPTGDMGKDTDWAIKQLAADLEKFLDPKRSLPKPEYYLFVTNLRLSGVSQSGGRDRVNSTIDEYVPRIKLKGGGCWDYNDLRGFLDGDDDIRSAYGALITAGDVLAQMMERLKPHRPDFVDVMHTFLQKELLADMSAKLQAAGEDPEVQIPLANVFVDLPITDSAEAAALPREREDDRGGADFVEFLLDAGSRVLRRRPLQSESLSSDEGMSAKEEGSRFVLVGGPGQGKSTLAQYVCQLYRAAILEGRPVERLDEKVHGIIRQLKQQRDSDAGLPLARRFPLRVELKAFSQTLAGDADVTLLQYIQRDMARLGSSTVEIDDLKNWLGVYPWLVVLDGLDEVPPSSNRAEVMREIEHFRVDAASRNADILIIATTRPQSYSKEFPAELFQHLYLRPLSAKESLSYGRRLAQARCAGDERRCEELMRSLEKACENEATARLMQSPLQVTIMATLLEETGEPPQQRYRLFAEYYRTIYKRETRRKLLGGILSERQTDIDVIHAQTGLLLHAMGERTRKPRRQRDDEGESAFSDDQFRELVRRRLSSIRVAEPKASELLHRITDSSLQRLVFITRPREGWIRFDITSFKEFMAAEALMSGPDENIRERLKVVAAPMYWRNVLLFAIGRCFVEKEHLLDNVVSICIGLNDETAAQSILVDRVAASAAKAALWGSRLALEVLSDGTARQNPEYEARLARTALELVRLADPEAAARLAAVYHADLSELFRERIEDRLGQVEFTRQRGAWLLLMNLADRNVDWAKETAEANWPADPATRETLLMLRGDGPWGGYSSTKIVQVVPYCDPARLRRALRRHRPLEVEIGAQPQWWSGAMAALVLGWATQRIELVGRLPEERIGLAVAPIPSSDNPLETLRFLPPNHHPAWAPFVAAARFVAEPSAPMLAEQLNWLSNRWVPDPANLFRAFPWPLGACLRTARNTADLKELSARAASGRLGSADDWAAAELRWSQSGLTYADLQAMTDDRWPFDREISKRGFPFAGSIPYFGREVAPEEQTEVLLRFFRDIGHTHLKRWLASYLRDWIALGFHPGPVPKLTPSELREILALSGPEIVHLAFDRFIPVTQTALESEWIDFLVWVGDQFGHSPTRLWMSMGPWSGIEHLVLCFAADPEGRRGLLPVLAELAACGERCEVPLQTLERCRKWENAEEDCLLLRLARRDRDASEAPQLAREVVKLTPTARAVGRALAVLDFSARQRAAFALALLNEIPSVGADEGEAVDLCIESITEYLNKRPSPLNQPEVWQRLKLPEPI